LKSEIRNTLKQAILITGAAGGIGQAIVNGCKDTFPDYAIIATDIDKNITTLYEKTVLGMQMDVTDEYSIASVRKEIENKGLQIWGLINNAGVSDFFPVTEKSKDTLESMYAINTFGPVNMVRAFLTHLIATKGRVVNISSESIRLPAAFHPYANTKIALEALSVSMRNELALHGARLVVVRPGAVNTPFLNDLHELKDRIGESIYSEYLHNFALQAPKQLRRVSEPEEVAAVIIKALQKRKPKRYYLVNNNPLLQIGQRLPHGIRDRLMQKMLRAPRA
jgi:NAD(P)-dependent dehydrogenase (short-subunit alcohol dehydrogenase family)